MEDHWRSVLADRNVFCQVRSCIYNKKVLSSLNIFVNGVGIAIQTKPHGVNLAIFIHKVKCAKPKP